MLVQVVQVSAGGAGQLTRTVTNPEVLRQQAEQQAAAKQQSIDAIKLSQQKLAAKVSLQNKHMEKQKVRGGHECLLSVWWSRRGLLCG